MFLHPFIDQFVCLSPPLLKVVKEFSLNICNCRPWQVDFMTALDVNVGIFHLLW